MDKGETMEFVQPIRDTERIRDIAEYLKTKDEKYYVMFMTGIYSGLRVSDILKLQIRDVRGKKSIKVKEKKTGKVKMFAINPALLKVFDDYCKDKPDYDYLIPSAKTRGKAVDRTYAWKVIKEAGQYFGISDLGTHSMRKTFGYHYYMQTKDIAMLQKIYNHSHPSITLRYIGIEQSTIDGALYNFRYK